MLCSQMELLVGLYNHLWLSKVGGCVPWQGDALLGEVSDKA